MERYLVLTYLCCCSFLLFGQAPQYAIHYKKLHRPLNPQGQTVPDSNLRRRDRARYDSLEALTYRLLFTANEAHFHTVPEWQLESAPKMGVQREAIWSDVYYRNLSEALTWRQTQYGPTVYVVDFPTAQIRWELRDDTRDILGFPCRKAVGRWKLHFTASDKEFAQQVTAWFAEAIPYPFGPAGFDGLPGLVLAFDYGRVERYEVVRIQALPADTKLRMPPRPSVGQWTGSDHFYRMVGGSGWGQE